MTGRRHDNTPETAAGKLGALRSTLLNTAACEILRYALLMLMPSASQLRVPVSPIRDEVRQATSDDDDDNDWHQSMSRLQLLRRRQRTRQRVACPFVGFKSPAPGQSKTRARQHRRTDIVIYCCRASVLAVSECDRNATILRNAKSGRATSTRLLFSGDDDTRQNNAQQRGAPTECVYKQFRQTKQHPNTYTATRTHTHTHVHRYL
jgi:hypothetical protein